MFSCKYWLKIYTYFSMSDSHKNYALNEFLSLINAYPISKVCFKPLILSPNRDIYTVKITADSPS